MADKRPRTHLCLVSKQAAPNLVPCCDLQFRPAQALLLVSPGMQQAAGHLQTVLERRGVTCRQWPIDNPFDARHVQQRVDALIDQHSDGELILNTTGGTKPMSLGAYQAFAARGLPAFYVHPQRDEVVWLQPPRSPHPISDRVDLVDYLNAHGYQVDSLVRQPPLACPGLAEELIRQHRQLAPAIGVLNLLAASAEHHPERLSNPLRPEHAARSEVTALIDLFASHQLLQRQGDQLGFPSEAARFQVCGGWLEGYLFERVMADRLSLRVQDCAMSVRVRSSGGSDNELDVAFLSNNKLYQVECKTRQFKSFNDKNAGSGTLYKMETLRDIGGAQTRAMLASYQKLRQHDRQRAADLGIETAIGADLGDIATQLKKWIRS